MPASRSRTERWRECLDQVYERGGGLELAVARDTAPLATDAPLSSDLVWRVRILGLTADEILIEAPMAMGQTIPLRPGIDVVAVLALGQNRWMFKTAVTGSKLIPTRTGTSLHGIKLAMPTSVERCLRRNFLRVSTAELNLPLIEAWPLLDPTSVVPAEVANRALIHDLQNADVTGLPRPDPQSSDPLVLPEVGPKFQGRLVNIGGGGIGLLIPKSESSRADRSRLLWLRINLMPEIPAPLAVTARIAHTHLDSEQNLYTGVAFEFGFHAAHRPFVVEQISRYVNRVQARQASTRDQLPLRQAG